MDIRVSAGTEISLGMKNAKASEQNTTAYLMIPGGICRGGCSYCPQAKGQNGWLSRIRWPLHDIEYIIEPLKNSNLERICLQCPDIEGYEEKIVKTVEQLAKADKPLSVSAPIIKKEVMKDIMCYVDHIGVGIDAVTDDIRKRTKVKYDPLVFWSYLGDALDVFGSDHVTAHFIIGMGENLKEVAYAVYRAHHAGARVSLFSYLKGDESPDISYFRQAQLLTYLIVNGEDPLDAVDTVLFEPEKAIRHIENGAPFITMGCPGCNRPYYTTRPGQEHRNYPRPPSPEELDSIKRELGL